MEHLCKEKLECVGKLPHVLNVVVDAEQFLQPNTNTNDLNDMDEETDNDETQTQT